MAAVELEAVPSYCKADEAVADCRENKREDQEELRKAEAAAAFDN